MPVPDGRRDGGDEDAAGLFDGEGMELDVENDIDQSEIPHHLRPLVSAAESGDLNALRLALGNYCFMRFPTPKIYGFFFSPSFGFSYSGINDLVTYWC